MSHKNLLSLNEREARNFFLQKDAYINFELPKYFVFDDLLMNISRDVDVLDCKSLFPAKESDNVNYYIFGNKDGSYAWRKYELINPIIYVSLVNLITKKKEWTEIIKIFETVTVVKPLAIPIVDFEPSQRKASQIKEWLEEVERESLILALDFEYLYQTDITNCYGTIYTHSVSWALHGKEKAKEKRKYDDLLGNKIDHHLQAMSYGQTNGIPQGSVLMDFIAEIVLAYADSELTKVIPENVKEYKILRYRDDYRIFVKNPVDGEIIMKSLSKILADLGMSLNTTKTKKSDTIILDSIKSDKLHDLNLLEISTENLRKELLKIYLTGRSYPNSGSVLKGLNYVIEKYNDFKIGYDGGEMISILVNIGFENPRAFPLSMAVVSKILEEEVFLPKKEEIIEKIFRKINLLPNNGFFEIWLQRIFIKDFHLLEKYNTIFSDNLCKLISNTETVSVFNNDWYTIKSFEGISCVDFSIMSTIKNTIEDEEISAINYYLDR